MSYLVSSHYATHPVYQEFVCSCVPTVHVIRSNGKQVWKGISLCDISMHRKSFNFSGQGLVARGNVCGRHSKLAADRSVAKSPSFFPPFRFFNSLSSDCIAFRRVEKISTRRPNFVWISSRLILLSRDVVKYFVINENEFLKRSERIRVEVDL